MATKILVVMTTLDGENEQTGVSPKVVTSTGTTLSREFPEFWRFSKAAFILDVATISGSGASLTVIIQGFNPVSGKWHDVVTFPAQTAASAASGLAPMTADLDFQLYRAKWTVAGTSPSITFSLCAFARTEA